MKLAFSTLGCPEWTWGEILSAAKDLGYNGVEVRGVNDQLYVPSIFAGKEQKIKEELNRLGLEIPCLTSACYLHEKQNRKRTVDECKEYIDAAKTIGVPYIRVLGDYNPDETYQIDPAVVVDAAQELGESAAAAGVMLLLETNGYFADSEKLAKTLSQINSPAVGALWDIHHPFRFKGEPPKATFDNLKGYIRHVHLKDSRVLPGSSIRYCIMGEGDVPVKECVEVLQSNGYEGYYSLEWTKRWNLELEAPGIAFANFVSYMHNL